MRQAVTLLVFALALVVVQAPVASAGATEMLEDLVDEANQTIPCAGPKCQLESMQQFLQSVRPP